MPDYLTTVRTPCKSQEDPAADRRYPNSVDTEKNPVWERIEKILASKDWRQQDLCNAAGITDSALSVFKKRAAENPNARLSAETAGKIAMGSGVSVDWLMTGRGPAVAWAEEIDPYPSRGDVLSSARAKGVDPHILDDLRREAFSSGDPGEKYWVDRLASRLRTDARVGDALERAMLPDDDTFGEHED